ncbi:MAG: hydrogenase maturation protease [Chloroflexi bacterium]|nr:hydrogenase maturation protease [Chloroflexota bacterium]
MILVIGYGSTLRTDDAIGHVVAQALDERYSALDVRIITTAQLMPELAAPISRADHVIFVDANADLPVGQVRVDPVAAGDARAALTHHVSPESLLRSAGALYGRRPSAQMLSIGAESFEIGLSLSPALRAQVPAIVSQAEAIVDAALHTLGGTAAV